MSDNIEYNKKRGTHSFVSHKELAWHGLGQTVQNAMTSEEAIQLANLDYEVAKDRVAVIFPEHSTPSAKYVPNTYGVYRTDTLDVFGVVSDKYEIVQNINAFGFMDSIVGKGKAIYETAGALGKGETIFITAKLPYHIRINGNDVIENYLVVSNGHDGRTSLNIFLTPIRVVCANTLAVGLENNKFKIKLRHTSSINDRLEDARNLLEVSSTITENMQHIFDHLLSTKVTDEAAEQYFNGIFLNDFELNSLATQDIKYDKSFDISTRKKNVITAVNKFYHVGVGQSNIMGTAYGVYNAVNGYLSNDKKYSSEAKRMESLVLGGSEFKLNNKALCNALNLE